MSPDGVPVVLDPRVRRSRDGRVLLGGDPGRLLRLGPDGPAALSALERGGTFGRPSALGRTLLESGLAHPCPGPVPVADVTVVVPVRDRADELADCLAALGRQVPVVVVDDGSRDPAAVAAVVTTYGATLVRRPVNGGPAAARNTGLATVATAFVAFVDSDCRPGPQWLNRLLGHFADPSVAAVAPRIVGVGDATLRGRVSASRSPLDLGVQPARVRPGTAVAYVPTAALVVRRSALAELGPAAFDPALRYGEDVDLVWRLHDAGWTVRYDPGVTVDHVEPASWWPVLERRFRYGASAGPLARRHGARLTHLVLAPWPTAVVLAVLARRPRAGLAVAAVAAWRLSRRLDGLPPATAPRLVADGVVATALQSGRVLGSLTPLVPLLPALPACLRRRALLLVLLPHLVEWARRRPHVDPLRFTAARLADEAAYGVGVWWGAVATRTAAPLVPRWRRPS